MESLGLDFSKLFFKKHGKQVFQDICNQIRGEYNGNCDTSYIDTVFTVAFISYFGVTDISKMRLLGGISKDIDIKNIQKIHKKSISIIQKYIENSNTENTKRGET